MHTEAPPLSSRRQSTFAADHRLRGGARGLEFIAEAIRRWLMFAGVETLYIEPGRCVGERLREVVRQPAA